MNKRNAEYEFIRTVAMIFVIGVHVANTMRGAEGLVRVFYGHFFPLLFSCGNGIFFMLSGKFALKVRCKTMKEYRAYYSKKLKNLILPIFVYMLLRSVYDAGGIFWTAEFWRQFFSNIFSDYIFSEYWFLYVLVGLILAAPFLAKIVERITKEEMMLFLLLGLGYNAMVTYFPYMGLKVDWRYPFGEWMFYFFLGYCLEKIVEDRKGENITIFLGGMAFLLSIVLKYRGIDNGIFDVAPTYTVMLVGMFFLLKRIYPFFAKIKLEKLFLWSGKYSMAVYMVHMTVLSRIRENAPLNHYLPHLFLMIFSRQSFLCCWEY